MRTRNLLHSLLLPVVLSMYLSSFGQSLPLKATHSISLETTEGSYMDVDLSPDGKEIVFTVLGEIFQMPAGGGTPVQITRGLAINSHPVWSPDGKEIAYLSDISGGMRVNVMHRDGTGQRILDASGSQIQRYYDIKPAPIPVWLTDETGLVIKDHLISLTSGINVLPKDVRNIFDISRDGRMYYQEDHVTTNFIKCYDRLTGETRKFSDLPAHAYHPRISPDGKWLIYIKYIKNPSVKNSLVARNLSTGNEKILVDQLEPDSRTIKEHYAFSSDSKYLLIGYNGKIHKLILETGNDSIIPFKALLNIDCANFNYHTYKVSLDPLKVRYTRSANESPDGKKIVFSALNKVYIMDLPNGKPRLLVNQPFDQLQPAFSPDGKRIAYVTKCDTIGGAVWQIQTSGDNPEQLTTDQSAAIYINPTWSPDGNQLAFLRDSIHISEAAGISEFQTPVGSLELLDIQSRTISKVADSVPMTNSLSFSADDKQMIYIPARDELLQNGNGEATQQVSLASVNVQDKSKHVFAIRPKKAADPLIDPDEISGFWQISLSPDRRYIVYEINEDLYLSPVTLPADTILINSIKGVQPIIRFAVGGLDPKWNLDGSLLSWSYANKFYRINPDEIIRSAMTQKDTARDNKDEQLIKVHIQPEIVQIDLEAPRAYAKGTIALTNIRIISMKGDEVIEKGTVIIGEGRFQAVGETSKLKIPKGTKVIDLRGETIIPGIIDIHDHVNTREVLTGQQYWQYLSNLAYGVTTARDPSSNFDSFGDAECIETGQMTGPRLFTVGVAVNFKLRSYEEALATVQKRAELGATYIKQYQQETRQQRHWLAEASQHYGLNMTNEGGFDFSEDIAMIKDGSTGIEHTPIWGDAYEDIVKLWSLSGTWHTPTLAVARINGRTGGGLDYYRYQFKLHPDYKVFRFKPESEYQMFSHSPAPRDTVPANFLYTSSVAARIFHAGDHVALGGHGNNPGIGSHWELWALQIGGLTNMEALREATIEGAKALGMQQDLGSIEPGKLADLIILDKNPLEDIHNSNSIRYVMKNGIMYDGNTLDEIWPEKKKLPEWRFKGSKSPDIDKIINASNKPQLK